MPLSDVVERAFVQLAFHTVAVIIQHDDNQIESEAAACREFHSGYLKRTIPHED